MRLEHLLSREVFFVDVAAIFGCHDIKDQNDAAIQIDTAHHSINLLSGGLAQLARAPALQAGGQGFDSLILHTVRKNRRSLTY